MRVLRLASSFKVLIATGMFTFPGEIISSPLYTLPKAPSPNSSRNLILEREYSVVLLALVESDELISTLVSSLFDCKDEEEGDFPRKAMFEKVDFALDFCLKQQIDKTSRKNVKVVNTETIR